MGYTTGFEGQFRVYRVESPMAGEFLKAIHQGDDPSALGIFADWLTDQGDPRGEAIAALPHLGPGRVEFWKLFGLSPAQVAYLQQFSDTRRMKRDATLAANFPDPIRAAVGLPLGTDAEYFVGGTGLGGQDRDLSILSYNDPPASQPGLWCQWIATDGGTAIEWDGGEKFYDYVEWLEYIIEHFLIPWGFVANGEIEWQGESDDDFGILAVADNVVTARRVW